MKDKSIMKARKKLSGAPAWNYLASSYTRAMKDLIIHIILRNLVKGWLETLDSDARVLCLGCGGGIESEEFWQEHKRLPKMVVVDIAENMLTEHASLNPNGRFERVHSDSLEYLKAQPDGSFDAVYSLNGALLSNSQYMKEYFQEVYRVLVPGGHMWLSMVKRYGHTQAMKAVADVDYGVIWPYPLATVSAALYILWHRKRLEDVIEFLKYVSKVVIGTEMFLPHSEWKKEICRPGFKITKDQETFAGPKYSKRGKPFASVFEAVKD